MTLKRFAGLTLNKRILLIAAFAVAIVAAVSVIPDMQRMVAPTHAQSVPALNGNYVVQASGTTYFYTTTNGSTEVLHYTMGGTATFADNANTSVNLTVNLGGEDDNSSQGEYNELICYLSQRGDLFYTAPSGSAPAMLTVTYHNGDQCGNPAGINNSGIGPGNGGVSELGNWIPFNFYPSSSKGGVIVSNYSYLTTGGASSANYPKGWIDSGSYYGGGTGSHVAYGFSVTGQLTSITSQ
ncbi:MAG TPA: hypothetical protein VK686_16105 [Bryobacteraceae bacterium]|jgi:hypothetical protein|nr:hypothetical protein [Bryobacteraceae bacterium]